MNHNESLSQEPIAGLYEELCAVHHIQPRTFPGHHFLINPVLVSFKVRLADKLFVFKKSLNVKRCFLWIQSTTSLQIVLNCLWYSWLRHLCTAHSREGGWGGAHLCPSPPSKILQLAAVAASCAGVQEVPCERLDVGATFCSSWQWG